LFQIDVAIVDTIIGSMYFDVDDESDSDEEAEEVELLFAEMVAAVQT
jgi:hypothetical protein